MFRSSPAADPRFVRHPARLAVLLAAALVLPAPAAAQPRGAPDPAAAQAEDEAIRIKVPTITVTALKEPQDQQRVPVSVTAVSAQTIESAGVRVVSDAAIYAPNTVFTEWTARKLSNARFRGISSSPNNPGITTYIDGVPQLSANSSSIELLDVGQIEFVRGPQSALFGRNTLGGLVSVATARPSVQRWSGALSLPFGEHGAWGLRGAASGPLVANRLSLGVSAARLDRDGFTTNAITGNEIDARSAFSTKAQLLWLPGAAWETRVIFTSERARDGDYALNDVAALRAAPFRAARDFEGRVDRDVTATTVLARRDAGGVALSSTTGFVDWRTQDVTDLDYTPRPILRRDNTERDFQFTQEVRVASADAAAVRLSDAASLRWQAGVFLFSQAYEQDAINSYAPLVFAPFAVSQHTPRAALDDFGVGVFGQATATIGGRLDLTGGARIDYEDKSATLEDFFEPAIAPASRLAAERSFSNVSPQVSAAFRVRPDRTVYGTVGRGYKAGGFNAASPAGGEAYGEERTWNVEGGVKLLWAEGRVSTNAAVFHLDWDDLQLNLPNPAIPAQFYVANVGGATSRGVELEVGARAAPGIDLFAALGYTRARFSAGSISNGADVEGNRLPTTPDYTASAGVQYSRAVGRATVEGRADAVFYGAFQYDDQNSLGQDAYSLVNLRVGVAYGFVTGELLVRNAFDTRYITLAFPYPAFAPSGFVGEMGAPRAVSVGAGVRF